jgi:flagellin-like hook-associated protein FlgL
MYQVSGDAVSSNSTAVMREQQRISSGRRLDAVSQDANAVTQDSRLTEAKAQLSIHQSNLDELDARYGEADLSLSSIGDALSRLHALIQQSRNGALGPSALASFQASISQEVQSIRAELKRADSQGRNLYSDGVTDADHPPLEVRPGQSMGTEIPLSSADATTLTNLSDAAWATNIAASSDAERAAAGTQLQQLQESLLSTRSRVGANWQLVQTYRDANASADVQLSASQSVLMDTNVAKSAAALATYSAQLQASRTLFGKLDQNNLFSLIR